MRGPLFARPPAGVVPVLPNHREPGKRVRFHLGQLLRRNREGMAMGEIRRATGLGKGEINAALGKMRAAGEVEAVPGEGGRYVYFWRFDAA